MGIWLKDGMYELRKHGKSHKTEIRHKTAAGRMAGNSETKNRVNFISNGRKPQTYMFEHITDLLLTCLSSFSHVFFPSFVTAMSSPSESEIPAAFPKSRCPPSNAPPPNWVTPVSQQLRARANQQGCSPSLEITGQFGHYRLQGTNPHEAQSFFRPFFRLKIAKLNTCNYNRWTIIDIWIMVRSQSTDDDGRIFAPSQCSALSIER